MPTLTDVVRRGARRVTPLRVAYSKLDAVVRYWPHMWARPSDALRFLFADREYDNYTYEISNRPEMEEFLASALSTELTSVHTMVEELEGDSRFREELNSRLRRRWDRRHTALYGRRAGWYALVRLCRPSIVVEVGVHDGLGSSVVLQALERNGGSGRLIGIDIDSTAGWLVPPRLRGRYELIIADSAEALPRLAAQSPIDLLLVDGDHGYEHERAEYAAALPALTPNAVLISDTARHGTALRDFAVEQKRSFLFWPERTVDHFFAGAGIGLSLPAIEREPVR